MVSKVYNKEEKLSIIEMAFGILGDCQLIKKLSKENQIRIFDKLIQIHPEILSEFDQRELALFLEEHFHKIELFLRGNRSGKIDDLLQQYFALLEFESDLNKFESEINSLEPGDEKSLNRCSSGFRHFIETNEKKNPDFLKKYKDRISEVYGDLLAIKSKGEFGSTRKIEKIERERTKKKTV